MSEPLVLIDTTQQHVCRIILNRPKVHNALNTELISELHQALSAVKHNDDIRLVVLQSNGDNFSAGADLNDMQRMVEFSEAENVADAKALADMLHTLNNLKQPTVARVQGGVFGGAVGLCACCDVVVASNNAKFCFSEVKLGLIPAVISPYVINAVGAHHARRLFLTAETFSAGFAQHIGLVAHSVSPAELNAFTTKTVERLLRNSPDAQYAAKQLIREVAGQPINDALITLTAKRIAAQRISQHGQEGLKAFLDKRSPSWQLD